MYSRRSLDFKNEKYVVWTGPILSLYPGGWMPSYLLPQTEDFMREKKDAIYICKEVEMEVIHCEGRRGVNAYKMK